MKKMNKSGLLSFTILLILVVMGIPVWNYFLGDGSLPSVNYLFFSFILFGVILLLLIFNLDKTVKLSNPVSTPTAEYEVQEEIIPTAIAEIEVPEEIIPVVLTEEKVEEEITPTPIAEEKPNVEVKNTPIEKPANTGDPKPYSPHFGSKRSGVWINEK
jgi:uncharacterized membrane protein